MPFAPYTEPCRVSSLLDHRRVVVIETTPTGRRVVHDFGACRVGNQHSDYVRALGIAGRYADQLNAEHMRSIIMPCDTRTLPNQTLSERKVEVKTALARLSDGLTAGRIKAKVGPQGAIAFDGWTEQDRGRVSDACAYRLVMATGSALAKAAIAKAEQLAGRAVDRRAVAHGHHSHDGGKTWHSGH